MKTSERTALIYGLSLLGATAVSYGIGGKRGKELVTDALMWGGVGGTVVNAVWFAASGEVQEAIGNGFGFGSTPEAAVRLLNQVSPDLSPGKKSGVKVGAVPADPHIVQLDEE